MEDRKITEIRDVSKIFSDADEPYEQEDLSVDADLPYPDLTLVRENSAALRVISSAYAGDEGELAATLQYAYQHVMFDALGYPKIAETLTRIAISEMKHMEILGKTILRLGAQPVYTYLPPFPINYYSARQVPCSRTPQKMLLDDVSAEQYAIENYTKMLSRLKDERVAAVIHRIKMDEEKHLKIFKEMLADFS